MTLYVHHVPGRLRLQTMRLKGNQKAAREACDAAVAIAGVLEARGNPATGSLIIHYDRRTLAPATLWQLLCERGLAHASLPLDGVAATRAEIRAAPRGDAASRLFEAVAGIVIDKLLERSAFVLMGSLV